jgi:tetratricopeptide (TPR) repeat protein
MRMTGAGGELESGEFEPISPLILAARALAILEREAAGAEAGGAASAPPVVREPGEARDAELADGVRAFARLGARALAEELVRRAKATGAGAAMALAEEQLACGVPKGTTRAAFAAHAALARGDDATDLLRALAEDATSASGDRAPRTVERREAMAFLGRLAAGARDFVAAADWYGKAYALLPQAAFAPHLAAAAGLAALWGGDLRRARASFKDALTSAHAEREHWEPRGLGWVENAFARVDRAMAADPAFASAGPLSMPPPRSGSIPPGSVVKPSMSIPPPPAPALLATIPPRASSDDGAGIVQALATRYGIADVSCPGKGIAHAAYALRRAGVEVFRGALSPELVEVAIALDRPLAIEEERPTRVGLRWVLGFERSHELLLVADPAEAGAEIVPFAVQRRRGALVADGALLVLGRGEDAARMQAALEARGLAPDPKLHALDRCDVDQDGAVPPPQEVRRILDEIGMADSPPRAMDRMGAHLLAEYAARRGDARDFLAWYVAARERFPDTEWPVQRYAEFLERSGRTEEAAIAWAEAQHWDPEDERNVAGRGRALERMGRSAEAKACLLRASALAPKDDTATFWLACSAVSAGDVELAEVTAKVAVEQDPGHAGSRLLLADALERRKDRAGARASLEKAAELAPGDERSAVRLARSFAASAAWEDAARVLAPASDRTPVEPRPSVPDVAVPAPPRSAPVLTDDEPQIAGRVDAACTLAWVTWAARPSEPAVLADRRAAGLLRAAFKERPDDVVMLAELARVLYFGALPEDEAEERLVATARAFKDDANAWGNALIELGFRRLFVEAEALYEPLGRAMSEVPRQADWLVGRTMLYGSGAGFGTRAPAIERILRVADASPGFEWPNIFVAAHFETEDPERALKYAARAGDRFAAAGLSLSARIIEKLGREADAAEFRARLADIAPEPLAACARRLREAGFTSLARAVIEHASGRFEARADIRAEQLRARLLGGDADAVGLMVDLRARGVDLPWALAVEIGARNGRWDLVIPAARGRAEQIVHNTLDQSDPWIPRAVLAGALLAVGEEHERKALLEVCPRHPDALAVLVRIERRLGHALAAEDEHRLRETAPAAWRRLDRAEVLPWT